ncbi:brachyurin-like [Uranotaenia lowii]|uniref:brachyurin-like n=1 Tax=Uranotaenia lowii TaxID=190385 RepID=UPI0024794D03|nr:brachyurin-like [Uranotaenia lowii]
MKLVYAFLWFVAFAAKASVAISSTDPETQISGGTDAGPNEFPFVVGLLISGEETHQFCAGVLISPRHVLTTANCVIRQTTLTIMLGSSDITRMQQFIPVMNIRIHWNHSSTFINRADLAILTMVRAANLNDSVAVARLPRRSQLGTTFEGFGATLVGWGYSGNREDETIPLQHLQVVRNPIITNRSCSLSHRFITDEHVCSGGDNGGPCDGDQGGPVMITENGEPVVIAIHSFHFSGIRGCDRGRSSVHTRITEHFDWIEEFSDAVISD